MIFIDAVGVTFQISDPPIRLSQPGDHHATEITLIRALTHHSNLMSATTFQLRLVAVCQYLSGSNHLCWNHNLLLVRDLCLLENFVFF